MEASLIAMLIACVGAYAGLNRFRGSGWGNPRIGTGSRRLIALAGVAAITTGVAWLTDAGPLWYWPAAALCWWAGSLPSWGETMVIRSLGGFLSHTARGLLWTPAFIAWGVWQDVMWPAVIACFGYALVWAAIYWLARIVKIRFEWLDEAEYAAGAWQGLVVFALWPTALLAAVSLL